MGSVNISSTPDVPASLSGVATLREPAPRPSTNAFQGPRRLGWRPYGLSFSGWAKPNSDERSRHGLPTSPRITCGVFNVGLGSA